MSYKTQIPEVGDKVIAVIPDMSFLPPCIYGEKGEIKAVFGINPIVNVWFGDFSVLLIPDEYYIVK